MPKFRFSLAPVLEHRRMQERRKQLAVAAAEEQRARLEESIRGLQARIAAAADDMRSHLGSAGPQPVSIVDVRFEASATLHLLGLAQRHVGQLAAVHRQLQSARSALIEATVARRAVEVLLDRRLEEWKQEEARRELAAAEDIAAAKSARQEVET